MKFKYSLIFILLFSCTSTSMNNYNRSSYMAEGFAYIYSAKDFENRLVAKKINSNEHMIGHNKVRKGAILKITNPINGKHITLKNSIKVQYPEFYKIFILYAIADKIGVNKDYPYVEVQLLKKNKSFVAKKAETFDEEKQLKVSAPIEKVNISNLGKKERKKKLKNPSFIILLGNFYSLDSAKLLKKRIIYESDAFSEKKVSIIKKNKHNFEVFLGPYKSIKMIEKDYSALKQINFDEVDIKLYE